MIDLARNKLQALKPGHIKVAANAFFILALRGLQRVVSLITIYVLVRVLNQDQFGTYQFVLSIVGLCTIFAIPGIQGAISQSVSRGFSGTYWKGLKVSFLGSLLGALVLTGTGLWYQFTENNATLAQALFIAAALFPFAHGLGKWRGVIAGRENFAGLLKYEGGAAVLTSLAVISITPFFPGQYLVPVIIILLGRALLDIYATLYLTRSIDKDAPVEDGSIWYGIKLLFISLVNKGALHIDQLLIFNFMSPTAVAVFFAADRITNLLKGLITDTVNALAPRFARQKYYSIKIDRLLKYFALASAVGAVVFAFTLMPFLLTFLFGDKYSEAIPYTQAMICLSIITYYAKMRTLFIRSKLDEPSVRFIVVTSSLVKIAASAALIPFFGILGAVISMGIYSFVSAGAVEYVMRKKYPVSLEQADIFDDNLDEL